MEKKVSVIIPVYNVEDYLNRCITSVIEQTYKNIEIIIVDDGSTDSSGMQCDLWANKDHRIRVSHQVNSGVSTARNVGLKISTGDAIIFFDPDDEVEKEMIENMVNHLFSENVDVICCGYTNEFNDEILERRPKTGLITGEECLQGIFRGDIMSSVWNKMFKRDVLLEEKNCYILFPLGIYIGEDFLWLAKVLTGCRSAYCIGKIYYHWYRRMDSATGNEKEIKIDDRALTEVVALEKVVEICKGVSEDTYYIACSRYFGTLMSKLKVADLKDNKTATDVICNRMYRLVKEYPIRNAHDFFKVSKARFLLLLKWGR